MFYRNTSEAFRLGQQAFKLGMARAPVLDNKLAKTLSYQLGNNVSLYKDWVMGWDTENLKETRKANPSQEAIATEGYEHFHGRLSEKVTTDQIEWPPPSELEEEYGPFPERAPGNLTLIGELVALEYEDPESLQDEMILFERPLPLLVSDYSREGTEDFFITGGKYRVAVHEDRQCGPLIWIEYRTVKSFDDFNPTVYKHRFEESYPLLAHSNNGQQLYILRGDSEFYIDRNDQPSAGIVG